MQPTGDEVTRLERVAHNRMGLWTASLITLGGLLLFVLIFNFVVPGFGTDIGDGPVIVLGLILSIVPALLWLLFFYRLDRLEPEPKKMVISVYLMGALVTAALHGVVLQNLFQIDGWLSNSWTLRLFGGILVVGIVEQALIYLTVRVSVFNNPEFDERVDGIIYGVAAGLGMATVLNFAYVVRHGGVDLDIGSIRMVVNALGYASFGGVLGYFMGQARFEKTPIYYLPAGLSLAAVFNGFFFFLLDRTAGSGLNYNPWTDLVLAFLVAIVTLGVLFWLVERANEETLRIAYDNMRGGLTYAAAGVPQEITDEFTAVTTPADTGSPDGNTNTPDQPAGEEA